jgi:DNA-binding Lrp family transcriptional regulator
LESRLTHPLLLDTILSALFFAVGKHMPECKRNQSRDLLRYLVLRLYDAGRGNLMNAELTLAQTTIAQKLSMSRQWVGELVSRLEAGGWIEHSSSKLPDGTNSRSCWRIGRMLKWLLVTLTKSKRGKTPTKTDVKSTWHFSPLRREKEIRTILARENEPPSPALLERIPILKLWLQRGKEEIKGKN